MHDNTTHKPRGKKHFSCQSSHCHPSSTCTLRCFIHMAPESPETVVFIIVVLLIYCYASIHVSWLSVTDCSIHRVFLKVTGDMEGVHNASRMVPCPGQGSANQREDKEGAIGPCQLRKRKKIFGCECLPDHLDYAYLHLPYLRANKDKYIFRTPHHIISHTTPLPVQTFQTSCLLNKISSFIRCFVPSGSHRVGPVGGSWCGSSFALQDLNK